MDTKQSGGKLKWTVIHFPEIIAGVALTFAISLATINAITRYAFSYTINGSDEYICIAFAWLVFLGGAAATRRGMHYGVDLIVNFLPVKIRALADILTKLIVTMIAGILTYLSYLLCINLNGKIFTATGISYLALDLAPLLGFALMTVYSANILVNAIRKLPENSRVKQEVSE